MLGAVGWLLVLAHVTWCSVVGAHSASVLGVRCLVQSGDYWFGHPRFGVRSVLGAHGVPVVTVGFSAGGTVFGARCERCFSCLCQVFGAIG